MTYQPPRKRRRLPWIFGGVAVVLLLSAGAGVAGGFLGHDKNADVVVPVVSGAAGAGAGVEATAPTAGQVKLTAKITEQTCYGDAGCSVTWHPEVTYTGPPDDSWVISYDVSGIESGADTGRIMMSGKAPAGPNDQQARTATKDSEIILNVTGVNTN